ncbi:hypothetical protein BSZ19_02220 [Bradyrhizobium japonicum]|uniref:Uncharacterized protein n=1 Tax=Bradyrhizobium japonicum TaxID=375 RepID=A0A1Y2JXI6_BRAJP|nr:hypothetical protein BSZ19_02220 [Bradyrhizobium japonicum]
MRQKLPLGQRSRENRLAPSRELKEARDERLYGSSDTTRLSIRQAIVAWRYSKALSHIVNFEERPTRHDISVAPLPKDRWLATAASTGNRS